MPAIALLLAITFSCKPGEKEIKREKLYAKEIHSFAKPNDCVIKHLNLDISVNFDKKEISGTATYDLDNSGVNEVILDSKFLIIENVLADNEPTKFELGDFNEILGRPLKIEIQPSTKQITD